MFFVSTYSSLTGFRGPQRTMSWRDGRRDCCPCEPSWSRSFTRPNAAAQPKLERSLYKGPFAAVNGDTSSPPRTRCPM
ncbi:hypothetical protein BDW62DRAFT_190080 [Aspergillus aurantiobrunneus]